MKLEVEKVVANAHRAVASQEHETLFIDDVPPDDIVGEYRVLPEEDVVDSLWRGNIAPGERLTGDLRLVVLSAPRTGRELFRVLTLVERLVASGGAILLLPFASEEASDTRAEATEVFCGAYPEWSRKLLEAHVVELRRAASTLPVGAGRDLTQEEVDAFRDGPASPDEVRGDGAEGGRRPSVQPSRSPGRDGCPRGLKKVVSLAVFGDSRVASEHWKKMPAYLACWVRAHHALFPSYELRIAHDDWIYQTNWGDVLHGLQRRGLVKLVRMAADGLAIGACKAMLWRLAPIWDPEVSHVFCRDVDSIPTWRDRMACEEFIESGLAMGTIHDNVQHAGIMGGLCHVAWQFKQMVGKQTFEQWMTAADAWVGNKSLWGQHGMDQNWLASVVVTFAPKVLEHSLFSTVGEGGVRRHRDAPTIPNADFRTKVAMPAPALVESVKAIVRSKSDGLAAYMGASGFDTERALGFYSAYSPVAEEVREAERLAGGGGM